MWVCEFGTWQQQKILRHVYSDHFNFIILLFLGILLFYTVNFDFVSLFVNSSYMFSVILNNIFYQYEWMNIVLFWCKKMFSHYRCRWVKFISTILTYIDRKKLFNQSQSIIYILLSIKKIYHFKWLKKYFFFKWTLKILMTI